MADQQMPNDAARKSKAEGERWSPEGDMAGANQAGGSQQGGGITNRPLGEEQSEQAAVPERGESKPGAHAGHGGDDTGEPESER